MTDWTEIKLSDIFDFYNGKSIKPGGEGIYKVYGSNGVIGGSPEYKYERSAIIGRVGAYCGSIEYSFDKFWASDNTIVAKAKKELLNDFFSYYLLKHLNLGRYAGGAAQPLLTQTVVKNIETKIPEYNVQQKIATILSTYDKLIENNTRRVEILEEMAQRIYKEWFVDFKYPGHENDELIESELGMVPEKWNIKKIGDLISLEYGKPLIKNKRIPGNVPVYGSSGIIGYHNFALSKGPRVVVGRAGNAGQIHFSSTDFFSVDSTFYVKRLDKNLSQQFLYYLLLQLNLKKLISGSAVPGINRNHIYLLKTVLPEKKILQRFYDLIVPIFNKKQTLLEKNKILNDTKDFLLPKLISGKVDVSDLDIDVKNIND